MTIETFPNPSTSSSNDHLAPKQVMPGQNRSYSCTCDGNAWREGDTIVLPRENGELPDRCVICNAPADFYRQLTTIRIRSPWAAAGLVIGPLAYAIAAKATERAVSLELGLCEKHRSRQPLARFLKRAGLALGVGLFVLGASIPSLALMILSSLIPIVTLAIGEHMMTTATVESLTQGTVRLRVGRPFLESIPSRRQGS